MNFKFADTRSLAISVIIFALSVLLIPFNNCSSSHTDPVAYSGPSQAEILSGLRVQSESVMEAKCASCHNQSTVDNGLTNVTDANWLENNGFVDLGFPQNSYLYLRVSDGTMPPSPAEPLTDNELAIVRDWIAAEGGNFDTYIGGTPIDGSGGNAADFNAVRQVLNQNCVACHRAGANPPRLDVDAATFRAATYNGQPLVVPNNANGSLLLNSFSRMPTGDPLGVNSQAANVVRSWINGGAL